MLFHPALQILIWCVLVALMQRIELAILAGVASLMLLLGGLLAGNKLLQLVRRTRWIMVSLLIIYAYTTPGKALFATLGAWSPVQEGLLDGVTQLLRLLAALASLAILLQHLPRAALISGLYSLFSPLKLLGLSRERCAIRLALTLHYAEISMLRSYAHWQDALQDLFEAHSEVAQPICLPLYRMRARDVLMSVLLGLVILGLVLR